MCSHFHKVLITALFLSFAACARTDKPAAFAEKHYLEPPKQEKIPASETALRVCADPNNMPFSNSKGEGFENRIASLIGGDLKMPVEYTWWAQRRGFFRNTLKAGTCDVVMGVPLSFELASTTRPYYRSTYVFVSRHDRSLDIASLNDVRLKSLKIGVQMIGDDGTNAPPAHALANRGIIDNVRGYTVYGNYSDANPTGKIIDAVESGEVDLAIVWGPLGGYFASGQRVPLDIRPVTPQMDLPYLPFVYDISVGVRRGEDDLKSRIEAVLDRRRGDIDKILADYHVPRVDGVPMPVNKGGV